MTLSSSAPSQVERWLPWVAGALALAPLAWCSAAFSDLWWFGDDWDLLDQISQLGFWRWTLRTFAENFVPLFKILWGGMVFVGGGSYFPMIASLWLSHAVNVGLLACLLRRTGFGWCATSSVLAVFAFTAANLETLGWSVQWSAILATSFFLAATEWHARHRPDLQAWSWKIHGVLALLIAASALSFSRGVLTGLVLALVSLVAIDEPIGRWLPRIRTAAVSLAPAVTVAAVIFFGSRGNHLQLGEKGFEWLVAATEFGAWYWAVAPLHRLIELDSWGGRTTLILGAIKIAVIVSGLRHSHGSVRRLLVLFLLLDLGNAALLGIGRYHTGLLSTNAMRYQYSALLCTLPFLGHMLETWTQRLPFRRWHTGIATVCVILLIVKVARPWPREVEGWADSRGRNTRELLLRDPNPPPMGAVPGIDFMSTERAKELVAHYGLH